MKTLEMIINLFRGSKAWTAVGHALQSIGATVLGWYILGAGMGALPAVFYFFGREAKDAEDQMRAGKGKGEAVKDGVLDWIPGAIVPAAGVDIAHRLLPDFWGTTISVLAIGVLIGLAWLLRPERREAA